MIFISWKDSEQMDFYYVLKIILENLENNCFFFFQFFNSFKTKKNMIEHISQGLYLKYIKHQKKHF